MNARTRAVLADLDLLADPSRRPGMAKVGINVDRALGVSIPHLRRLAKRDRPDHPLALDLWRTGVHEARILAFDPWDLCDQVCGNLFEATPFGLKVTRGWTRRAEEFVKRAGFALVAEHAVRDRTSPDHAYTAWFPTIRRGAARPTSGTT